MQFMAGRIAGCWEYARPAVRLYGSTERRQVLYLFPFCFICHWVCDSVVVKHLVDSTTSSEGEDKVQDRQGGLPCKFLNQHQIVSPKVCPLEQNESNCRLLKRDRGSQVAFRVGKALISKLEAEIAEKAAQPVFFHC